MVPVVEDETDDDLLLSAECCSTSVDVEEIQGEQGDKTAKRKNTKKMEEVQSERRSKRKRGAKRFQKIIVIIRHQRCQHQTS